MGTFFDKFKKYAKPYTRERIATEKDSYGQSQEVLTSSLDIKGILTRKSVSSSMVTSGKWEISYWKSADVLYASPDQDILPGDFILNGKTRYLVEHISSQDDFKTKNSHNIIYLKNIV